MSVEEQIKDIEKETAALKEVMEQNFGNFNVIYTCAEQVAELQKKKHKLLNGQVK